MASTSPAPDRTMYLNGPFRPQSNLARYESVHLWWTRADSAEAATTTWIPLDLFLFISGGLWAADNKKKRHDSLKQGPHPLRSRIRDVLL